LPWKSHVQQITFIFAANTRSSEYNLITFWESKFCGLFNKIIIKALTANNSNRTCNPVVVGSNPTLSAKTLFYRDDN